MKLIDDDNPGTLETLSIHFRGPAHSVLFDEFIGWLESRLETFEDRLYELDLEPSIEWAYNQSPNVEIILDAQPWNCNDRLDDDPDDPDEDDPEASDKLKEL